MKTLCPVCGVEGSLQQRGNSRRIQHYMGRKEGKRIYSYHKMDLLGRTPMEVKTLRLSFNKRTMADGEGFEPSTPNLGGWCSLQGC